MRIISQPNAHPMNSDELGDGEGPYVTAALNGDVDNFADLKVSDELRIAAEITSDAKVIPTLVSRRLAAGDSAVDAFRQSVRRFDGSVAIAANVAGAPRRLQLALRGSGQALYVGLDDDLYVVASEPYGVVEETSTLVIPPNYRQVVSFCAIALLLLLRPQGLFGVQRIRR